MDSRFKFGVVVFVIIIIVGVVGGTAYTFMRGGVQGRAR